MSGVIYAGIGARDTPPEICGKMCNAARAMARMGFTLRSGGAAGADTAFEEGAIVGKGKREIYLPYRNFRGHTSELYGTTKEARNTAKQYHPNWPVLSCTGRDFMGRNAYQILGLDLKTPCHFVLCWTANGKAVGGTGQAIRHANALEIPVLNFATHSTDEISDFIFAINERHAS